MRHLTTAAAAAAHLTDAVRGRDRWIFVADSEGGHLALVEIGAGLLRKAAAARRPPPELAFGCFDFCNLPTRCRGWFSVLTVPKSAMTAKQVQRAVRPTRRIKAPQGQDIIIMAVDVEAAATLLAAAERGELAPSGAAAWN
jgi:hypothetical protein